MSYNELKQHGTESFPAELYHIDKSHPRYEMALHWHYNIEIIRIIEGRLEIWLNNEVYTAGKNDIIFVNSETVHGAVPHSCVYECIVLNPDYLRQNLCCEDFFRSLLSHASAVRGYFAADDSVLQKTVHRLFDTMTQQAAGNDIIATGLMYQLFGEIVKNGCFENSVAEAGIQSRKNVVKLKKALEFMRASYETAVSLEKIADAAGMSSKYFCSFFKEMTNKSPFEYLTAYRIEKAAQLLLSSDMSVTDIAYSCGFNDLSYFIKTFKKIKGVSPGKFRLP